MVAESTILIATTNKNKLREVQEILAGLSLCVATLDDHPPMPKPIEDADSFDGNARLKALHYARLTQCWTLADDSGLEVDALDGAPGVYSSRYAGANCSDAANNAKLLGRLASVPPDKRTACFRCLVALANPSEVVATASGVVAGRIIDEARGENGFGYDPHFFVPVYGMTTAEMKPELKNRISHRGQAFRAIRPALDRFLVRPTRDD